VFGGKTVSVPLCSPQNALRYSVGLRDKYIRTEILLLQQVPQHKYMSYTGFI